MALPRNLRARAALESLIGSAGILLAGFITIPVAAFIVGAHVSIDQGASMSVIFFFARWVYLFALRSFFAKKEKLNG